MRLKAVLGIKIHASNKIRKYRILDEDNGQIRDIPVNTIIEAIKTKGALIEGLQLQGNEIVETCEITKIPELRRNSMSLYDWCQHNEDYGRQLLQEYIQGNNDITPDKILYASNKKAYFRCSNCGEVNYEMIGIRTKYKRKCCVKCKKESTSFGEQLILKWIQSQGLETISQKYFESEVGSKFFDIYIPALNLVIEHQSSIHKYEDKQFNDQLGEIIAQQLGLNYLEVCELDSGYCREENNWCITYVLKDKQQMINKLQAWFLENYNLQLSNIISPEVGRSAWMAKFKVKYEDSLAYRYPAVASQFIPELNYGLTTDLVPHNSGYRFWLQGPEDKEPKFTWLHGRTKKYKKKK